MFTTNEKFSPVSELDIPMSGIECGIVSDLVGGRWSSKDHRDLKVFEGPLLANACCVRILSSSEIVVVCFIKEHSYNKLDS